MATQKNYTLNTKVSLPKKEYEIIQQLVTKDKMYRSFADFLRRASQRELEAAMGRRSIYAGGAE